MYIVIWEPLALFAKKLGAIVTNSDLMDGFLVILICLGNTFRELLITIVET